MDKEIHQQIVQDKIENAMATLFPHGAGRTTHTRVEHHLRQIAQVAFREGESYALLSLLAVEDALGHINARLTSQGQSPISRRRLAAIIHNRHERFGVGMQLSGGQWLVRHEDLDSLMPDIKHRRGEAGGG